MRPDFCVISLLSLASLTVAPTALGRDPVRQSFSNSASQSASVSGPSVYANAKGYSIDFDGGSALAYLEVVRTAMQFAGIVAIDEHLLEEIVLPAIHLRGADVRTAIGVLTATALPTRSGERVRVMSNWVGPVERIGLPSAFTVADDEAIRRGACLMSAEIMQTGTAVGRTVSIPKVGVPAAFSDAELGAMTVEQAKDLLARIAAARQVSGLDGPTAERLKGDFHRVLQRMKSVQ